MQKNNKPIITGILFGILILSIYLTITNTWIAADINYWQTTIMGNNKYFPMLTIACFFVPPAMILLFIQYFLIQKQHLKNKQHEKK